MQESLRTPKPIIHLDTYNPAANRPKMDKGSSELFYRNLSYNQLMDKYLSGIIEELEVLSDDHPRELL